VELTERNQSLKIILAKPENEGKYVCVVKNRLHEDSVVGYVTISGERERELYFELMVQVIQNMYSLFIMYIVQTENGEKLVVQK
jgi:hypothetical protein